MRLIEHPGADFALLNNAAHGAIEQLFGRDDKDADIAQTHAIEYVGTFWHGEQAVDRRAGIDVVFFDAGDLIGHQRHQGRNDDRQRACLVKTG